MRHCKLLLAAACCAVLLSALVGSASAGRLSTVTQTFRSSFRSVSLNGVFGSITCQMSLEGSLHSRTIAKSSGTLIGYVTAAALGTCAEGRATILRETLPWHVRYASFSGTLPNITSIRVNVSGFSLRIQEPFAGCLWRSEAANPLIITLNREAGGSLTTAELGGTMPSTCGFSGTASSDRAPVTILNSTVRVTVTLI
ncbi:MAG TPA: hypothetical protein VFS37_10510 [Conexibacter sp.]|nr:hypothetical protein [Conexibacter sp.]